MGYRTLTVIYAAFLFLGANMASAQVLGLSDITGDPSSALISPGASFNVNVTLTANRPFTGLTYFLEAPGSGSGLFSITGRSTLLSNPLEDATTTDAQVISAASLSNLLDPRNDKDLGYGNNDPLTNESMGGYLLTTLTLTSDAQITPGTYMIQTAGGVLSDADFNEFSVGGGTYSVTVVPEPASVGTLVLLGSSLLLARTRRQR